MAPFVAAMNAYPSMPVFVAGTNLRLKSNEIFFSITQKKKSEMGQEVVSYTSFLSTSASECSRFLEHLLQKAKINASKEEVELAGEYLQGICAISLTSLGRPRWMTRFITKLLEAPPNTSFMSVLESHFEQIVANGVDDPSGLQYRIKRFVADHTNHSRLLSDLLVAYHQKEGIPEDEVTDYIDPGLAHLQPIPGNKYMWTCTEV